MRITCDRCGVAALGENDLGFSFANQGYDGYRHWKIAIHTYAYYVVLLTLFPDCLENGCYPIGGGREPRPYHIRASPSGRSSSVLLR
jgi:hypothetical protein